MAKTEQPDTVYVKKRTSCFTMVCAVICGLFLISFCSFVTKDSSKSKPVAAAPEPVDPGVKYLVQRYRDTGLLITMAPPVVLLDGPQWRVMERSAKLIVLSGISAFLRPESFSIYLDDDTTSQVVARYSEAFGSRLDVYD